MHTNLMSSSSLQITFNKSVIFKTFNDFKFGYSRLAICNYRHFLAVSFVPADCAFNNAGIVIDPGKLLLTAVGSLTQPIFARGKLIASKKIAQLTEEDLQKKYVQTVINAGNQVNEAMADCMSAREKHGYYQRQVQVLGEAYTGTHELMDNGKASYLEVLKAQESLLDAQLSQAMNMYDAAEAVIALYIALGGATK